ncbi:MAG TPA: 5'/3'-nucleotidase SurE [Stellaceae bacterium]|nr:5'/3'-nucleotidase SurE [Stellaceae bacterium]
MLERPLDLAKARILVTNDDGIEAKGLKLLFKIARTFSQDVWVVAPELEQSGASHSLTLHRPLRVRQRGPRRFVVDGTPTDCVLLAVNRLLSDKRPSLVLSGINAGANLGEDVTYSGTVAAAMEAILLGVPAIALSMQAIDRGKIRWETAEAYAAKVIRRLVAAPWAPNTLINVNFPDLPADQVKGIAVTRQGRHKIGDQLAERIDPRGRVYYWIGPNRDVDIDTDGTDIAAVTQHKIALTPISLDLTNDAALKPLRRVFK